MPVKMAFSSSPYTAEGTLRKRANVQVGVTSTQEQMQTGAMPSFGGTGLMEGQWDARDANGLPAGSRFRDEDGVDRVKEPPADLLPVLLFLKDIIGGESIVLEDEMKYSGGTQYGTMTKGQFHGVLVKLFTRHILFTDDLLAMICNAYGTGLVDHKNGGHRSIAWKDFCEDIDKLEGSGMTSESTINLGGIAGGKSRDPDGTLDRVSDPPEKILKWLLALKLKNKTITGVDLVYSLRSAGGKNNGLMDKSQFLIQIKTVYREFRFKDWIIQAIVDHYGVGDNDAIGGGKKLIAWKDFCEDVDSQDLNDVTPELDAINRAGSGWIG